MISERPGTVRGVQSVKKAFLQGVGRKPHWGAGAEGPAI